MKLHSNTEPDNKYMIFISYIYYIPIPVISDSVYVLELKLAMGIENYFEGGLV